MKVTINVPPDIEKLLLKKCEKTRTEPSELIQLLLEWYFLKWKKSRTDSGSGFIKIANQCAMERVKYCKYSDGKNCARHIFNDIVTEKDPQPIVPYKCLFCSHFVDKREPKAKTSECKSGRERKSGSEDDTDLIDQTYEIARVAARLVVELYSDKLGYRPKQDYDEIEEEAITRNKVEKLLENW